MGVAFTNPSRRYKNFRPRQAVIGSRNTGTPVNLGTVALYNNTLGPHWLVVRDATISGTASALVHGGYVQGNIIAASGVVQNMIPTDALLPGLIGSVDTATVYSQTYLITLPNGQWFWQHELPWAIIPPGFAWVVQGVTAAQGIGVSYIWEAIFPEELDFLYDSLPTQLRTMAQLTSRGTLTRNRWDYFESSNGWASVYGSVASGPIAAFFQNALPGQIQLDIYALYWWASVAFPWQVTLLPPPLAATTFPATEIEIHASQPDQATPAGICGMYSAYTGPFFTIQRVSDSTQDGTLIPVPGYPFITLPPMWTISIGGPGTASPCEMSLNVWFQNVLDTAPPAP